MVRTLICLALLLSGCSAPPKVVTHTIKVPIPVPCVESVPEVPSWPLDNYRGESLDRFVAATLAERVLRDAYESRLSSLLEACIFDSNSLSH